MEMGGNGVNLKGFSGTLKLLLTDRRWISRLGGKRGESKRV